jgi:hypothetical protein
MDPVAATPTEPRHYALVTAGYGALVGAVALVAASRQEDPAPADPGELLLYGAATAGLTRVLSKDKVSSWVRAPFVDEPADGDRRPRGEGLRYAVGELLTCTRCLGSWSALTLVGLRAVAPRPARVAATLLALSAVNTVMQAGMTGVQARASREEGRAAAASKLAEADAPAIVRAGVDGIRAAS